jgi:hypothetical protein
LTGLVRRNQLRLSRAPLNLVWIAMRVERKAIHTSESATGIDAGRKNRRYLTAIGDTVEPEPP